MVLQNGWELMTFQVWHKTSHFLMIVDLKVTYQLMIIATSIN